nr:hypothetical protein BaRGS_014716 [Batillaria attramentaria]
MKKLDIDPAVLRQLRQQSETAAADEEALEAMRTLVRVCPECQAVNKEYMTWCLQCGGVLIGVEPVAARNLKKKNNAEKDEDGLEVESENIVQAKYGNQLEASQAIARKDLYRTEEHLIEEEDVTENKESPESGKGPSASSSPARKAGSQDNLEDSEDPSQDTLEVTENKDSGRPSSGEGPDARKGQSQSTDDGPPQRTQKEISDICEVISDPIIRGFIKSYLQKRPGQDEMPDGSWMAGSTAQQQAGRPSKDSLSHSLSLDLGASFNSTASAAVATQNSRSKNVKSPEKKKGQRKNSKVMKKMIRRIRPALSRMLVQARTPRIQDGDLSKWLCLPDELWLHVFSYLPQTDLFRVALTCKQLYRIALDDTLWKYLTVKKKTLAREWLTQIAHRHPVSLALVQCHGENIDSDALRELFREIAPHLKELNFSRCSRGVLTGDNILLHASARCRNLTHVDASWCHVTDNGLSALAECCHRLESLCLNGCQMITDESLEAVLRKHGQSLRVLELFGCFGLTQSGFRSLATYCTFLLTLNIGQCHKVTDSCVATLSASLGRVENLDLRGCKQIKDNCIRKIVRNCPRLRMLTLANCPSISDSSIVEIATYSGDIRVLDVCGCRNITDTSIRTLANNCGRLTSIDISSTSCTHKSALLLASYSRCLECAKFNFLPDVTEACLLKLIRNCKRPMENISTLKVPEDERKI